MVLAEASGGGLLPLGVCLSSSRVWNDDFGVCTVQPLPTTKLPVQLVLRFWRNYAVMSRVLFKKLRKKGDYLLAGVQRLRENYSTVVKEVRGQGLMVGVEFESMRDVGSYEMAYMEDQEGFTALIAGFLLNVYQIRLAPFLNNSMTLRLEPTLTISYSEIDRVLEALEVICQILNNHDYASLYRYLIGDRRHA